MKGIINKAAPSAEKLLEQDLAGWRLEFWYEVVKVIFKASEDIEIEKEEFIGYFPSEKIAEEKMKMEEGRKEERNTFHFTTSVLPILTKDGKTGFVTGFHQVCLGGD